MVRYMVHGKFSRPPPSIRKGGTTDKNSKKNKSNSKMGDNAKGLHSNEQPPMVGGNDGCCGVGTTTMETAMNHSNSQPSHDKDPSEVTRLNLK